jgi:hypothetical protein
MWCAALAGSVFGSDDARYIAVHGPGFDKHVTKGYKFSGVKDTEERRTRSTGCAEVVYGMRERSGA